MKLAGLVLAALIVLPAQARAQTEQVEYYALDAIGSVRAVFDASGTVVARLDYEPFGRELSSSATGPDRKFAGLFRDAEAGLDYAQARSYQHRTGRFNAPDPVIAGLFEPQRWNRYSYTLNNPLTFVDPEGLDPQLTGCGENSCTGTDSVTVVATDPGGPGGSRTSAGGGGSGAGGVGGSNRVRRPNRDPNREGSRCGRPCDILIAVVDSVFGAAPVGAPGTESPSPSPPVVSTGTGIIVEAAVIATSVLVSKRWNPRITRLFRTVGDEELASIGKLGRYAPSPTGMEGKHFYPTAEQAANFARYNSRTGHGPQTLTSVKVSTELLERATPTRVLGEGQTFFFNSGDLPVLGRPTVWGHWPR